MQIYLPIAEISIDATMLLMLGASVGFLSGMFGVGGGFMMTPLLIFIGIPPPVAVGTQANQLVANSVSGVLAHLKRGNVDMKMGLVMLTGGVLGTLVGIGIFRLLSVLGQIDLVISLSYVITLGIIGSLMIVESARTILRRGKGRKSSKKRHGRLHGLPWKTRFPRSKLYISALLPGGIGFLAGLLNSILGIGGGFFLIPAMIYLIGMPASLVAGTSLFQIMFTTAVSTFLHAWTNQTVDVMLALILLTGGVIGAQYGSRVASKIPAEVSRALLAVILLIVAGGLARGLVVEPDQVYSVDVVANAEGEVTR
ncbi:MAG: permease [Alphaproteobacteria bacterium]|nr:permease [Alphaproteobacteria bacterium]MAS47483.1 permease [Alphaproteobacteria bacterium]MAX96645.1 permease [Alphaproteobacteria bacterium]MBN52210.1 permease [Alphaproteobacteria bacterium]OUT41022.1 MAG: permease [Micavibrio sp. TMED2]|tara:strand:+ start:11418 stop:12350 length:933 start_codon:yes stop_codon:yes gene_type:complete